MSDQVFYERQFLNDEGHHNLAAILAEVDLWESSIEGCIEISDCGRKIELDFWASNDSDYQNGLKKLDRLIDTISGFREAYVSANQKVEWKG